MDAAIRVHALGKTFGNGRCLQRASTLSGGQQQRAAIARALEAKQAEFGPCEPIPTTRFDLRSQT